MELHLKIVGTVLILLGFMHIGFPRYFHWKKDLASLELINREMMIVHTFFLALVVAGMGFICLFNSEQLLNTLFSQEDGTTSVGKTISLSFAIFWTVRLLVQLFGYSPELWRGKRFETIVHVVFIFLWSYVSGVFWTAYLA